MTPHEILHKLRYLLRHLAVARYGICSETGIPSEWLTDKFRQWPEFSGCPVHPVPSCCDVLNEEAYYTLRAHRWNPDHPYGQARIRLLDFLIECAEREGV